MAVIDFGSITEKVNAFINSKEGRQEVLSQTGVSMKGAYFGTDLDMDMIVRNFLIDLESEFARAYEEAEWDRHYRYPFSGLISQAVVRKHNSTNLTPHGGGTKVCYEVFFGGTTGLSRDSLTIMRGRRRGQKTGRGISNILALFEKGYDAKKQKFGMWHSRSRGGSYPTMSRVEREGLKVIAGFVDEFNARYNNYGVCAELNDVYR